MYFWNEKSKFGEILEEMHFGMIGDRHMDHHTHSQSSRQP